MSPAGGETSGASSRLASVSSWMVDHAAVAIIGSDGVVDAVGDLERRFPLASVSKLVFAIAAQVAVEEGTLALDEPAGPAGSTVAHLLAHASGLSPDDATQSLAPVGTRRIYSNAGFDLLEERLGANAGFAASTYVDAAVVEPLGLANTDVDGPAAHGYSSSVSDLARLVTTVVAGGLLAPETVAAMTTPYLADLSGVLPGFGRQEPNPWGLGVEVRGGKSPHWTGRENAPTTWGHFGQSGTFVWWDPVVEVGLIGLTDRSFGSWAAEAWPALADQVLA